MTGGERYFCRTCSHIGPHCSGCPFPAPHLKGAGLRHSGRYPRLNLRAARGPALRTQRGQPRRRNRTLSSARLVGAYHQLPSSSLRYLLRRRGMSARHCGRRGLSAGRRCRGGATGPSRLHVSSARIISFPHHPSATSSAVVACQLDTVAAVACQLDVVAAAARTDASAVLVIRPQFEFGRCAVSFGPVGPVPKSIREILFPNGVLAC